MIIPVMLLWWAGSVQNPVPDASMHPDWRVMQFAEGAELRYLPVVPTVKDYPRVAIRLGAEGTSFIRLKIDPPGEIVECTTARSSGWEMLDEGACALFRTHGRFKLRATKPVIVVAPVEWKLIE